MFGTQYEMSKKREKKKKELAQQWKLDYSLIKVCSHGKLIEVLDLIKRGANVNAENGWALYTACENDHLEVVKELLYRGADVHARADYALRVSCDRGHVSIVRELLRWGANVHANNEMALQWACQSGHVEIVKILLDAGSDSSRVDLHYVSNKRILMSENRSSGIIIDGVVYYSM